MDQGWGAFRTTDGDVSVGDDTIRIHKTPRKFLQGQLSHWRNGSRWQQVKAVFSIVGFLFVPLSIVSRLYMISEISTELVAFLSISIIVLNIVSFWAGHIRDTKIPLSSVEDITLDTDERDLTITHDADLSVVGGNGSQRWFPSGNRFAVFETGDAKTTLTLRTTDDAHKARTIFRTRGIAGDLDTSEPEETETEYRFDTKSGVIFCERCGSQVSPSDRACPACDYALRIERPVGTDPQELSTEF